MNVLNEHCYEQCLIAVMCAVNQTVQHELTRMEKRNKAQECSQRKLYKKMLGTANDDASDGTHEVRLQRSAAFIHISLNCIL